MKHRLRYLSVAVRNGMALVPRWAKAGATALVVAWLAALALLPGPEDPVVRLLSPLVVVAALAVWLSFHLALDLRTRYPPLVLLGAAACLGASALCVWREFSRALVVRLSLPLLLLATLAFYLFYFSVYFGRQRLSRLQAGARFPDFALPDSSGRVVTLPEVLTQGPVLFVFYKGDW
jgi:hypothetical protein